MKKLSKRIRSYLYHEEARCRASTIGCYRTNLAHFSDWLHTNKLQVRKLTAPVLRDYSSYLYKKDLAPYTRVNYLLSVKKYLQWEIDHGTLKETVISVLNRNLLPKVPEYLPKPLSSENDRLLQERLYGSASPYASLFLLLRQTGLRISELINLTVDCVVKTHKGEAFLKVPLGKMNNERLVPLSAASIKIIEKIKLAPPLKKDRRSDERLIGISGPVPKVYYLLSCHFKKIVGNLNDQGKSITFHRLRHTYATSLLSGGVGLLSLMKLLGHRRIEMTLRYAKVTPSHLRNEYLKAMKFIESQSLAVAEANPSISSNSEHHPAEIIAHIIAFLNQTPNASPKNNILRRLKRIHADIANLSFHKKFKLRSHKNNHMVK